MFGHCEATSDVARASDPRSFRAGNSDSKYCPRPRTTRVRHPRYNHAKRYSHLRATTGLSASYRTYCAAAFTIKVKANVSIRLPEVPVTVTVVEPVVAVGLA